MRMCTKCGRVLSEDNFYIRRDKGTYQSWCIDCCKAHGRLRNGTTGIYKKQENMNEINYNGTTIRVESITPQLAEIYLGKNTHNRNLNKRVVDKYANDIKMGFWHFDGAPIRFAADGTLLDGQHRLHAIIKSNTALDILVVRGLGNETQATMDIGSVRQACNFLQMNGVRNATIIASMVRGYISMKNNINSFYVDKRNKSGGLYLRASANNGRMITVMEIVEEYNRNSTIYNEIATFSNTLSKKSYSLMAPSPIGTIMYYIHKEKNYDIMYLVTFFSEVLGIINITNPTCRLLYDRLMKIKNSNNYTMSDKEISALFVKVFNCYVDNIELKKLILVDGDYGKDFKAFENKISM